MTMPNCERVEAENANSTTPESSCNSDVDVEGQQQDEVGSPVIPALVDSLRLQPIRHKWKNVIFSILDTGVVCLELLQHKDGSTKTMEVFQISPDGFLVQVYYPNNGKGIVPGDEPPPLSPGGPDEIHAFDELPAKHLKKYLYASKCVNAVKSKTPKVIYYSKKAKFMLMENGPVADFQAAFYDGARVTKTGTQSEVVLASGWRNKIDRNVDVNELPPSIKSLWDHFQLALNYCVKIENCFEHMRIESGSAINFPVKCGKRPPSLQNEHRISCAPKAQVFQKISIEKGDIIRQIPAPDIGKIVLTKNKGIFVLNRSHPEDYITAADYLISCTPARWQLLQTDRMVKAIVKLCSDV